MQDTFSHHKAERENIGKVYRTIEEMFKEDVSIELLDPRNVICIASYFFRQVKHRKIGIREALFHLMKNIKREAVFINGTYVKDHYENIIKQQLEKGRLAR
jgi:hypothetical protein